MTGQLSVDLAQSLAVGLNRDSATTIVYRRVAGCGLGLLAALGALACAGADEKAPVTVASTTTMATSTAPTTTTATAATTTTTTTTEARDLAIVSVRSTGTDPDFNWVARGELTCQPTFAFPARPLPNDPRVLGFFEECQGELVERARSLCADRIDAVDIIRTLPVPGGLPEGTPLDLTQCDPGALPTSVRLRADDGLTLHGIGGIRIGATIAESIQAVSAPVRVSEFDGNQGSCYFVRFIGIDGLTLWVHGEPVTDPLHGTIDAVVLRTVDDSRTPPLLQTRSGLAIGDPIERAIDLYGDQVVPFVDEYGAEHLDFVPRDPADANELMRISYYGGTITEITAGHARTVQLEEGCS